jgi:O-antigen/teichoic acid export membrane protein
MEDHDLTKHSIIMMTATMAANFFNYLFQLAMGRLLSLEDYGILYSLLSLVYIINVGGTAIQTSIGRYTSKLKTHGEYGKIKYLWDLSTRSTLMLGVVMFLLVCLLSPLIAQFFNISNTWYIILLASYLLFSFAMPANQGLLMGLQKFWAFGLSTASWALLKLLLGVILVFIGFGIYGGLLAPSVANITVFLVTLVFIRHVVKTKPKKFDLRGVYSYSGLALLAGFSFTSMLYVNVILTKHFLDPTSAGAFSALAVLGQIVFFAPSGIALAMFPKTSESFEKNKGHLSILLKALLYTIIISGFVVLLFLLFPKPIAEIMFGDKSAAIIPYMFEYGVAMFLFAVVNLLVNYSLSIHKTRVAYVIFLALLMEVSLMSIFHSGISNITHSMLLSGAVAVILIIFSLKWRRQ